MTPFQSLHRRNQEPDGSLRWRNAREQPADSSLATSMSREREVDQILLPSKESGLLSSVRLRRRDEAVGIPERAVRRPGSQGRGELLTGIPPAGHRQMSNAITRLLSMLLRSHGIRYVKYIHAMRRTTY